MSLRIHNTLTRRLEPFESIEPGHVRMYVCGMTIYDLCHVGHARMAMAFDVMQRWLRTSGWRVTYVRNVTDIEDKIIRRAVERGITIRSLTDEMIAAMRADLGALGIEPPTHEPRATDHVPQMLAMIGRLEERGLAYRAKNGDVNFAVRRFPGYGRLSGKSLDELRAGERVAIGESKDDPLDFVLWKAAKAGEPADAQFESRYGAGRPGWHIECSSMSAELLGPHFDIHGGGLDLQFPHHENEIAQSEGANGAPFVEVWAHNGLLNVDDAKMSKSLGNFFTIREVLDRYDGETLRFFMLRTHYRSPLQFSDVHLDDARAALRRLYTALEGIEPQAVATGRREVIDWSEPFAADFRDAMDDDFNTPAALAALFELASALNRSRSPREAALLKSLGGTLGVLQQAPLEYLRAGAAVDEGAVERRIEARAAAKAARDFNEADRIRDELAQSGIRIKDTPSGTTWVRA